MLGGGLLAGMWRRSEADMRIDAVVCVRYVRIRTPVPSKSGPGRKVVESGREILEDKINCPGHLF